MPVGLLEWLAASLTFVMLILAIILLACVVFIVVKDIRRGGW